MTKKSLVTTPNAIRKALLRDYDLLGTWEKVGQKWGMNKGLAFMIAKRNYEPKDPHLRHKLGLAALIPALACPKCGEVHVKKRCPRKSAPKHWRDWPDERIRWALENREELVRIRTMP
jgi:hypothetical protein